MYSLTEEMDDACQLFDRSGKRDVTIWHKLISDYSESNRFRESCKLFKDMVTENLTPNYVTCNSVLPACAKLKDLELGVQVHLHVEKQGTRDVASFVIRECID
jgi:pentatricopeptide repeat protein